MRGWREASTASGKLEGGGFTAVARLEGGF